MTIGTGLQALLLAAAVPTLLAGSAAQAQGSGERQAQTTGRNVTGVTVDAGPNAQYVMEGAKQWAELDSRGRATFHFRESARDDWSVYLVDAGRGIELQLDLHRRKVLISERGGPRRDLYNIVRFTSQSRYAPPIPTPTPSPRSGGWSGGPGEVDGRNAVYVRVGDGGYFEQASSGRWSQYEPNGRLWATLDEISRDASTVRLADRTHRIEVVLDLRAREVRGTEPGSNRWKRYYSITDADARRGGGGRDRDDYRGDRWDNDRDGDRDRDRDWDRDGDWGRDGTRDVEVGPIWSQRDAETKCRAKADEIRAEWTGNWSTTVPGRVSVCAMRRGGGGGDRRDVIRQIEVGPIWNQRDAETKCRDKARELRAEWTGQWRTTVQGRMSECELRFR